VCTDEDSHSIPGSLSRGEMLQKVITHLKSRRKDFPGNPITPKHFTAANFPTFFLKVRIEKQFFLT
jgi:hypothetical protein